MPDGMMTKPSQPKILVAMPAYDEEKYIGSLILKARQYASERRPLFFSGLGGSYCYSLVC
jgi:hypothetical protein